MGQQAPGELGCLRAAHLQYLSGAVLTFTKLKLARHSHRNNSRTVLAHAQTVFCMTAAVLFVLNAADVALSKYLLCDTTQFFLVLLQSRTTDKRCTGQEPGRYSANGLLNVCAIHCIEKQHLDLFCNVVNRRHVVFDWFQRATQAKCM